MFHCRDNGSLAISKGTITVYRTVRQAVDYRDELLRVEALMKGRFDGWNGLHTS
jgi:hypothetical protein